MYRRSRFESKGYICMRLAMMPPAKILKVSERPFERAQFERLPRALHWKPVLPNIDAAEQIPLPTQRQLD